MRREELYLRDIVEAANHIAGFIAGLDPPGFGLFRGTGNETPKRQRRMIWRVRCLSPKYPKYRLPRPRPLGSALKVREMHRLPVFNIQNI
jgi:hypothetical protein